MIICVELTTTITTKHQVDITEFEQLGEDFDYVLETAIADLQKNLTWAKPEEPAVAQVMAEREFDFGPEGPSELFPIECDRFYLAPGSGVTVH